MGSWNSCVDDLVTQEKQVRRGGRGTDQGLRAFPRRLRKGREEEKGEREGKEEKKVKGRRGTGKKRRN